MLTKDQIKYITQNIQPKEAEYVFNAANIMNNAGDVECTNPECNPVQLPDDILLLNQLVCISNKLINCTTCVRSQDYRNNIQDLQWVLRDYIENFSKSLKMLYGFDTDVIVNGFELPIDTDPLETVNLLKDLINDYLTKHGEPECALHRVMHHEMTNFLSKVLNAVYQFRLAGLDAKSAQGNVENVPTSAMPVNTPMMPPMQGAVNF